MMSRMKSRPVALNAEERQLLSTVTSTGAHPTQEDVAVRAGVRADSGGVAYSSIIRR